MTRITMNEYQRMAQRTSPDDGHDRMDNGVLGLIGETGEIVDLYKKYRYQSKPDTPMPRGRFLEELGDVLWYMAELAQGMGRPLAEIVRGTFVDYDNKAANPAKRKRELRRVVLGLSGRANSIQDYMDKNQFKYVESNMRKLMAGAAALAYLCGGSLQDVALENIAKLQCRYPNGFDAGISMGRYE